jgi:stage V sporulation protein D (sporulation-specific penicillin-binding protein)
MSSQPYSQATVIRKRMEMLFIILLSSLVLIGCRLGYLQWYRSSDFLVLANRMQTRTFDIDPQRGKIRDRNGAELATDVLAKSIAINPRVVRDKAATATRLAELLDLDAREREALRTRMLRAHERGSFYSQLRRGVPRKQADELLQIAGTDGALTGLWLEDSPQRVYPSGRDGSQIVGPVNIDREGIEGIELRFNSVLRGKSGKRRIRVDAMGQPIPDSEEPLVAPEDGSDVTLAIDRNIQHFVEKELERLAQEQSPDGATAIVMDVRTGDVLAMANWPTYDVRLRSASPDQRRNRAITDMYEPGSTFKVLTAAAALEAGVPTTVQCGGTRAIGSRRIKCAHGDAHGSVDLKKMVEKSCNIAAGTLAERIGPKRFYRYLEDFGCQTRTGIEFPGEVTGRMLPPEKWRTMRTVNIGFGQGIVVTPIQLVAAYAAIANDGLYLPPRLVLDAPGMDLSEREPRQVMKSENARKLRAYMEAGVLTGTGKNAKIAGYSAAGKTGTAQIAMNGRYGSGYVASFVGFLPAREPRLAILVSVWRPRNGQYGGTVAAPVFREIARQTVGYLRMPPDVPGDFRDGADPGSFYRYAAR